MRRDHSSIHRVTLSVLLFLAMLLMPPCIAAAEVGTTLPIFSSFHGAVRIEMNGTLGRHGVLQSPSAHPHGYVVSITNWERRQSLKIGVEVIDHLGRSVAQRAVQILSEPGETAIELLFDNDLPAGWYRLLYEVFDSADQRVLGGRRDFVVLEQREPHYDPDSRFGLMNAQLQPHEAELMRDLGVRWILGAGVPRWEDAQFRADGAFVWRARADEATAAAQSGLLLTGRVGEPPLWARARQFDSRVGLADEDAAVAPSYPISDLTAYFRFVGALANHFDEELLFVSSRPPVNRSADYLGSVHDLTLEMKLTAAAPHAVGRSQPKLVIEVDGFDEAHLASLLEQGVYRASDTLLIHLPTSLIGDPEALDQHPGWQAVRRLWNGYGGGLRIWTYTPHVSLFDPLQGGAGAARGGTAPVQGMTSAQPIVRLLRQPTLDETDAYASAETMERLQAAYLVRHHLIQWANGVERIFSGPFSTGESGRRLFSGGSGAFPDVPQRPRQAIAAYATMTKQLENHTYMGRIQTPPDVWAFVFARDGEPVLVSWTPNERAILELNVNVGHATVYDLMGHARDLHIVDGRLLLPIGPEPQYVRGLDAGVLARVMADDALTRVLEIADLAPQLRVDLVRLSERIERMATELWLWAAADRIGSLGWSSVLSGPLGNSAMTPGIGLRPLVDLDFVETEWTVAVSELFAMIENLGSQARRAPDAQAAIYGLLDLLPSLVQVIAATDRPLNDLNSQEILAGTEELLREAADAVRHGAARSLHAARMYDRAEMWHRRAASAAPQSAIVWALVAREVAARAVLHRESEDAWRPGVVLRASAGTLAGPVEPVWDVGIESAMPEDVPAPDGELPEATQLLQKAIRAAQLPLRWLTGSDRPQTDDPSRYETEAPRWLRLGVPISVLNGTGVDVDVHLGLSAPEGWLWELEGHALSSHTRTEQWRIRVDGEPESLVEHAVELDLLVPADAKPGTYELEVELFSPEGVTDTILFRLNIPIDPAELSGV